MTSTSLHRATAALLFFLALVHAVGLLAGSSGGLGVELVLIGMRAAPLQVMGVERTMMDLYTGYSALFVVYLLFGAVLSLELARLSAEHPQVAKRIALAHGVTLLIMFVLSLRYFFLLPALLALLPALAALGAGLRKS